MSSDSHTHRLVPKYIMSRRTFAAAGAGAAAVAVIQKGSAQDASPEASPENPAANYPMTAFNVYVVGLHCAKEDPMMQMEAHHFCQVLDSGVIQCALFDGGEVGANLIGVEYLISGEMFDALPHEEHQYWHPHNYEIVSGVLGAPDMTDDDELGLMTALVNSYGKTWHTWHTGRQDGQGEPGDDIPMGAPMLQWSFNRDGEVDQSLVDSMSERLGIDFDAKREARQGLVEMMTPQEGVDDLKDAFPNADPEPPAGVEDAGTDH